MIISAHQPVYLPGIILFNKIALSDAIVLIGHVQMERTSWQTRNRIRDNGTDKEMFLSVPIRKKGRFGQSINDTEIADQFWQKKHLKSIYFTYKNRPFFDAYFERLKDLLEREWTHIADLNVALMRAVMDWLGLGARVLDSRGLSPEGEKTDMLVSLCRSIGAAGYVSNVGAQGYVEEVAFERAGIKHYWQDFGHPVYDQGAVFMPNLSIIDLLFNAGPESADIVQRCGRLSDRKPEARA